MTGDICGKNGVRGHVSLWRVDEKTGLKTPLHSQSNQIQYTWGYLAAKALGYRPQPDRPPYHISTIYFEFENVSAPETTVTEATSFSESMGIAHYNSLSGNRDYLRVPLLLEPAAATAPTYEDKLPVDQATNQLTFFAQTAGTTGVHGLGFGHNVGGIYNSKIYAVALVASPFPNDPTKDVIFARTVFTGEYQVPKEASSQIGITWNVAFT